VLLQLAGDRHDLDGRIPAHPGKSAGLRIDWRKPSLWQSSPGALVQTGSNPFTYQFTLSASNFVMKCPSEMKLSLEWNAGLGFVGAIEIPLSCAGC
jgi:hypothetical protein